MPLKIFRNLFRSLVGKPDLFDVEHRFFNIANLVLTFIQLFYLVFNAIVYPDWRRFFLNGVSLLFAGVLYLAGRFLIRKFRVIFAYIEFTLFILFYSHIWWVNHGSAGAVVYSFFSILTLFVMFLKTPKAIRMAVTVIGIYVTLSVLEFLHPEWLWSQPDQVQFFVRRVLSAGLNLAVTAFAVIYLKFHYQQRKENADDVNARLAEQLDELKKANQRIASGEELFRIAAEKTGQMVYDYDIPSGRIQWAGAITELTGLSAREFQSVNIDRWSDRIHPEDRAEALEKLDRCIRELTPYLVTYRFLVNHGNYIYVQDSGAVLPGPDGQPRRMIGTQKDITDQVRYRQELEQKQDELQSMNEVLAVSEAKWRSLAESIPSNVLVIDRDMKVTYVQQVRPPFQGMQLIGSFVLDFVPEDQKTEIRRNLEEVLLTGQNRRIEFSIPTESGILWYNADAGPVRVRDRIEAVIVSLQNITDIKNIQKELEAKKAELESVNANLTETVKMEIAKNREKDMMLIQQSRLAAMGEMINAIAHQWRQPLNATGILVQTIEEYHKTGNLTGEFLQDAVDRAMKQIRHMSKTIDDFRNFFRSDREPAEFSVRQAVEQTLNLLDSALKNDYIAVETDMPEDVMIHGFPNEYSQVLLNVLVNAKEALVERKVREPRIRIRLMSENGRSVLTVTDNAGGIEPAALARVFDPYFTTKESGTGIGLYMCKMIIERNMRGSIGVANGVEGAEFTVVA